MQVVSLTEKNMHLDWNASGWFGGQLGGTAWILVAAAITFDHNTWTGLILLMIFLVPNIVGYLLWRLKKFSCHASLQILFGLSGLFGLLTIYVLDRNHLWLEIQKGGSISAVSGYFLLTLIILILMITFYLKFGRKPNASST
jgi:hypothetical protein